MTTFGRHSRRVLIGIVGGFVVLAGIIMIPYPGPGWLVVFAGLAILSTEFQFAAKVLAFAKDKYDRWVAWLKRQHIFIRILVLSFTCAVVLVTLWLVNAFGIANYILGLNMDWLISPFLR